MNPVPANQLVPGNLYLIDRGPTTLSNGTVASGKKIGVFHHYQVGQNVGQAGRVFLQV